MIFLLKHKFSVVTLLVLILSYFLVRLYHLTSLPIFTDEAIYIRWSQIALHDANWRFIALTDGKGPFFTWVMAAFFPFFKDPLIAGRMVSVTSGMVTLIGLWFLSGTLFKNRLVNLATCIFYITFPFAQVYDRLALYDSMVGMFAVWSLYFSIHLVKRVKVDVAYPLGFIMGAGLLTKSNALFSVLLLPFTLLLFNFKAINLKRKLINFIFFAGVTALLAEIMYNLLRLSPLFGVIKEKNALFVYPLKDWLKHPFTFFIGNLHALIPWLFTYLTIPFSILIVISLFSSRCIKEKVLLIIYFIVPFVALALFGKQLYPRFIYFMVLMLLPLAGFGVLNLTQLLNKKLLKGINLVNIYSILLVLFASYPFFISLQFARDPVHSQIVSSDYHQYVYDWSAGWGVKESISYFKTVSQNQKIFIGTAGTFGLLPQSLEIYLNQNQNVSTRGYWPIHNIIPNDLLNQANNTPTFVVFYQPCLPCSSSGIAPSSWPLKKLFSIHEPDTASNYTVYQVIKK